MTDTIVGERNYNEEPMGIRGFETSAIFKPEDDPKRVIPNPTAEMDLLRYKFGLMEIERNRYKELYELSQLRADTLSALLTKETPKASANSLLRRFFPNR